VKKSSNTVVTFEWVCASHCFSLIARWGTRSWWNQMQRTLRFEQRISIRNLFKWPLEKQTVIYIY